MIFVLLLSWVETFFVIVFWIKKNWALNATQLYSRFVCMCISPHPKHTFPPNMNDTSHSSFVFLSNRLNWLWWLWEINSSSNTSYTVTNCPPGLRPLMSVFQIGRVDTTAGVPCIRHTYAHSLSHSKLLTHTHTQKHSYTQKLRHIWINSGHSYTLKKYSITILIYITVSWKQHHSGQINQKFQFEIFFVLFHMYKCWK